LNISNITPKRIAANDNLFSQDSNIVSAITNITITFTTQINITQGSSIQISFSSPFEIPNSDGSDTSCSSNVANYVSTQNCYWNNNI